MLFEKHVDIRRDIELPLWDAHGDTRKVPVPAGRYRIHGTDGGCKSRIVVNGVSVVFDHDLESNVNRQGLTR